MIPKIIVLLQSNEFYNVSERVEIAKGKHEMVTKLEDFLRRRSKISLVLRREDILSASGLKEACVILFGKHQAEYKLQEYIDSTSDH